MMQYIDHKNLRLCKYTARTVSTGKLITMLGSAQERKIVIGTQMISVVEESEPSDWLNFDRVIGEVTLK